MKNFRNDVIIKVPYSYSPWINYMCLFIKMMKRLQGQWFSILTAWQNHLEQSTKQNTNSPGPTSGQFILNLKDGALASEFFKQLHCAARVDNHHLWSLLLAMVIETKSLGEPSLLWGVVTYPSIKWSEFNNGIKNHSWFCQIEELFLLQTHSQLMTLFPITPRKHKQSEKKLPKAPTTTSIHPHRSVSSLLTSS